MKDRAENDASKRAGRALGLGLGLGFFFFFLTLVSFLARSKPKVPFLGLSLLRNQTEMLATQATHDGDRLKPKAKRLQVVASCVTTDF